MKDITTVVAGNPQVVEIDESASVFELLQKAVKQAAYRWIVPEDWEIRDEEGNLLVYADRIPQGRVFFNRRHLMSGAQFARRRG